MYEHQSSYISITLPQSTVKSLINAHALINAHPPIWILKITIFWTFLTKIPASNKRPLEINGGKLFLTSAVCFLIHCSIANKNQVVIFISFHKPNLYMYYKLSTKEIYIFWPGTKVKHVTEVIKQTECFGCSFILCELPVCSL